MTQASVRSACTAALALTLAFPILRAPLARAAVARGDEFLYQGNVSRALMMYARAHSIDSDEQTAVDRYAFYRSIGASHGTLRELLRMIPPHEATRNGALLVDRGLIELKLRRYESANRDFSRAASLTKNPVYLRFARAARRHVSEMKDAR